MSSLQNFLNQKLTSLKNEAAAVVSNPTIVTATKRLLGSAALRAGRALGHLILKRTAEAKQEASVCCAAASVSPRPSICMHCAGTPAGLV